MKNLSYMHLEYKDFLHDQCSLTCYSKSVAYHKDLPVITLPNKWRDCANIFTLLVHIFALV